MAVGCWMCMERAATVTLEPHGVHVCAACAPEDEMRPSNARLMQTMGGDWLWAVPLDPQPDEKPDPTLHRWDMDAPPVVLRDDDGAPLRPCAGDWPEDDELVDETPVCPCCLHPVPGLAAGAICSACAAYPLD